MDNVPMTIHAQLRIDPAYRDKLSILAKINRRTMKSMMETLIDKEFEKTYVKMIKKLKTDKEIKQFGDL